MNAKDIFKQAEQERVTGSGQKSIELYEQAIPGLTGEDKLNAQQMLAVAYRMVERFADSERVLQDLLTEKLDPEQRGKILRDLGDAQRKQEKYEEADKSLNESLKLLEENGNNHSELGATLGFQARVLADREQYDQALAKAREASEKFAQGDNRHMELYHDIFLAELLSKASQPDEAKKLAAETKAAAEQYGKPVHVERLELIEQYADDPAKLEEAIKNQKEEA